MRKDFDILSSSNCTLSTDLFSILNESKSFENGYAWCGRRTERDVVSRVNTKASLCVWFLPRMRPYWPKFSSSNSLFKRVSPVGRLPTKMRAFAMEASDVWFDSHSAPLASPLSLPRPHPYFCHLAFGRFPCHVLAGNSFCFCKIKKENQTLLKCQWVVG